MKIKSLTQAKLDEETKQITENIKQAGWDDIIRYDYELSGVSDVEVLSKLLVQTQIIPSSQTESPDSFTYKLNKPISAYGNGVSIGGFKIPDHPYLTNILSYELYAKKSVKLDALVESLLGIAFMEGLPAAEAAARQHFIEAEDGELQQVKRGFLRVLIPVKYAEVK